MKDMQRRGFTPGWAPSEQIERYIDSAETLLETSTSLHRGSRSAEEEEEDDQYDDAEDSEAEGGDIYEGSYEGRDSDGNGRGGDDGRDDIGRERHVLQHALQRTAVGGDAADDDGGVTNSSGGGEPSPQHSLRQAVIGSGAADEDGGISNDVGGGRSSPQHPLQQTLQQSPTEAGAADIHPIGHAGAGTQQEDVHNHGTAHPSVGLGRSSPSKGPGRSSSPSNEMIRPSPANQLSRPSPWNQSSRPSPSNQISRSSPSASSGRQSPVKRVAQTGLASHPSSGSLVMDALAAQQTRPGAPRLGKVDTAAISAARSELAEQQWQQRDGGKHHHSPRKVQQPQHAQHAQHPKHAQQAQQQQRPHLQQQSAQETNQEKWHQWGRQLSRGDPHASDTLSDSLGDPSGDCARHSNTSLVAQESRVSHTSKGDSDRRSDGGISWRSHGSARWHRPWRHSLDVRGDVDRQASQQPWSSARSLDARSDISQTASQQPPWSSTHNLAVTPR